MMFEESETPVQHLISVKDLKQPIVVYGAGRGFDTLRTFVLDPNKIEPSFLLDIRFRKCISNHCGYPDEATVKQAPWLLDSTVIVSVGTSDLLPEIFQNLRKLGFKNVLRATDIYEYHVPYPSEADSDLYRMTKEELINQVQRYFFDSRDLGIAESLIRTWVFNEKCSFFNSTSRHPQFLPKDFDINYQNIVFAGGYTGETILHMAQVTEAMNIYCFEPEPINYNTMLKNLNCNGCSFVRVPLALGRRTESRSLLPRGSNSNLLPHGSNAHCSSSKYLVKTVALDDFFSSNSTVSYLVLDVEGSEEDVLRGAGSLIRNNADDISLAISIYHTPSHLLTLPKLIREYLPLHNLHLRNYSGHVAETVLYAVR
jgi:FkbM family methyltransferase